MKPLNLAIICIALLIAGVLFWPTLYRYDKTTESVQSGNSKIEEAVLIKINRLTGYTEVFKKGKWASEKEDSEDSQEEIFKKLPTSAIDKLEGNASIKWGEFEGKIYNGSDWEVREIIFRVLAKEKDGSLRWDRKFSHTFFLMIPPLRTKSFSVKITGGEDIGSISWSIVEAKGYKSEE